VASTSQMVVSVWRSDLYKRKYRKVVEEICYISMLYLNENNTEWIKAFERISKSLDEMSDRRIWPNVRKYIKDFIKVGIQAIKGKRTRRELLEEKAKTIRLLAIAYSS